LGSPWRRQLFLYPRLAILAAGTNTLAKFSIGSGGGTIGWSKIGFTVTTSTNVTVSSIELWDFDSNTQITGTASTTYTSTGLVSEFLPLNEQQVSGSKNYIVKATVGGTLATGAYVSTKIANPTTTFGRPLAATTATASPASFVEPAPQHVPTPEPVLVVHQEPAYEHPMVEPLPQKSVAPVQPSAPSSVKNEPSSEQPTAGVSALRKALDEALARERTVHSSASMQDSSDLLQRLLQDDV
jgi:hypothetical protein